ncbi:MAG: serine/threonine protein kinase [Planctomycetes bacterium]|nr:serine/threonine protein kinase [Planctomycetota bacterium]
MAKRKFDIAALAVDTGLVTREQVDKAMVRAGGEEDQEEAFIETLMKKGYINEEHARVLRVAANRLAREGTRKENIRIGGYEIISKVGEGGLGVVYKARQMSMGRTVALKVLHPKWANDDEFKKRFLLEARLVGRLSHQNLIQVYDVGRDRGTLYFSMEFVDGSTVEEMLDMEGPLSIEQALDITTQVLRAVTYIWRHKIVHRDIKPGNIMVTRAGVAKLGDFGFVKSHFDPLLADEGEVLGTPDYISPEQAMGKDDIDFRSDVYSLGATLYQMVTGKPPFSGSGSSVMRKHIREDPKDVKQIKRDLPDPVAYIIRKMMSKDPDDRYQNTQELFEDLEMVKIGQEPLTQREEIGHSTIIRAMRLERSRLERSHQQRDQMTTALKTMKYLLYASFAGNVLLIIAILIMALR